MFFSYNLLVIHLNIINKILWIIAISLIITNSIYFSIKLSFPQLKIIQIKQSIKENKTVNISPKDTLIMALSSKIGVGSLSGIAVCIYYGGIGTIFWIFISTLFLSIIAYIENELAVIYKEKDGKYQKSGPAYYIDKGLNNKKLGIVYSIIMLVTYTIFFSAIQNNTITTFITSMFDINKLIISLIITISVSLAITKGIKGISNICNKTFTIMMLIFIGIGIVIIIRNINEMPLVIELIIKDALFAKTRSLGILYSIIIALQKSIFANESGVGTNSIISGTTDSNDYKLQGKIGLIQTFFINFIVLGITSLIIITAKVKNISISNGIELTKSAINYHFGFLGDVLLLVILILFSYSSIITIYYYGENCLKYLTSSNNAIRLLKIITIISIMIGGIINAPIIWGLIDIALALLTIINMYAIYKLKETIIIKNK